jgi:hypothetical protein
MRKLCVLPGSETDCIAKGKLRIHHIFYVEVLLATNWVRTLLTIPSSPLGNEPGKETLEQSPMSPLVPTISHDPYTSH